MAHKVRSVKAMENNILLVCFQNGTEKTYDLRKVYTVFPQFEVLASNRELYERVRVDTGGYGISWNDELDLDAEELWDAGENTGNIQETDIFDMLSWELSEARERAGMTQKQLAEATGIYQADISKIERGKANPALATLKRLADGMGMKLEIRFAASAEKRE